MFHQQRAFMPVFYYSIYVCGAQSPTVTFPSDTAPLANLPNKEINLNTPFQFLVISSRCCAIYRLTDPYISA
jgi:hypothetical protein